MKVSNLLLIYFVVGAVMWSGGALEWGETGPAGQLLSVDGDTVSGSDAIQDKVEDIDPWSVSGLIQSIQAAVGIGFLLVWPLLVEFLGFLFWPVATLMGVGAPVQLVVVVGGGFSMMFLLALIMVFTRWF